MDEQGELTLPSLICTLWATGKPGILIWIEKEAVTRWLLAKLWFVLLLPFRHYYLAILFPIELIHHHAAAHDILGCHPFALLKGRSFALRLEPALEQSEGMTIRRYSDYLSFSVALNAA